MSIRVRGTKEQVEHHGLTENFHAIRDKENKELLRRILRRHDVSFGEYTPEDDNLVIFAVSPELKAKKWGQIMQQFITERGYSQTPTSAKKIVELFEE